MYTEPADVRRIHLPIVNKKGTPLTPSPIRYGLARPQRTSDHEHNVQVLFQGLLKDLSRWGVLLELAKFHSDLEWLYLRTLMGREKGASSSLLYALSSAAMILISNRPSMVEKESGQRKGFGKHCNDLWCYKVNYIFHPFKASNSFCMKATFTSEPHFS